jgi:hypothetical protein
LKKLFIILFLCFNVSLFAETPVPPFLATVSWVLKSNEASGHNYSAVVRIEANMVSIACDSGERFLIDTDNKKIQAVYNSVKAEFTIYSIVSPNNSFTIIATQGSILTIFTKNPQALLFFRRLAIANL